MKTVMCLTLISALVQPLHAQTTYGLRIGGSNADWPCAIVQTADHGLAWVGTTWSDGINICAGKVGSGAIHEWSRSIGGSGYDQGSSIAATSDGGIVLGGTTTSFGARSVDCFVAKCDAWGEVEWARTIGGVNRDNIQVIIQTTDGGYAFAGSTISFPTEDSWEDIYFVKLDAMGGIEWSFTYYQIGDEMATSMIQTRDGGYMIAGNMKRRYLHGYFPYQEYLTHVTAVPYYEEEPYLDILLIKLDGNGVIQWVKTQATELHEAARSVIETHTGDFVVCGSTTSFGSGASDVFVLNLDKEGNLNWTKTFGGTHWDEGNCVIETADKGFAICGTTSSFGHGREDIYVIKLSEDGSHEWSKGIGGPESDAGRFLLQEEDGRFVVTGITYSFGARNSDIFLAKINHDGSTCDAVSIASIEGNGGKLFSFDLIKNAPPTRVRKSKPTITKFGETTIICSN